MTGTEPTTTLPAGPAAGESPSVALRNVTKRFDDFTAVDDLTLELGQGEFFTLLGPSGCGKTTTLRMIAGFERPTSGEIAIEGEDVAALPAHKRPTNTVFQSYALFPHLSVEKNVAFGLKRKKVGKDEIAERVATELKRVGLAREAGRRPSQLSGGMQQRVALARALVNLPKVLLLDEPLGALDLKLREQMQTELKSIQGDVGITFVYVTHDQDEALTMSDRIAVFNEGRIEQISTPEDLYEHPVNEFVADFVGVSNVIERGGERFTVRPEKIEVVAPGAPADGLVTERGRVVEVAYAGAVTRYTVELDAGGSLQLVRQNVGEAPGAVPTQGAEGLVGWRPQHAAAVRGNTMKEEVAP